MDGYPYFVSIVSLISGCDFPPVWNAVFQEAEDVIYLALSLHIYESVDGFPLLLLPKSSGCCFQYAVTVHLIGIGGVSINVVNAFHQIVDVVFQMFSLLYFKKAVDMVF